MSFQFRTIYLIFPVAAVLGFLIAREWHEHESTNAASVVASTTPDALAQSSTSAGPILVLPEFSLQNRANEQQSIRSWPGKSLIINFWATWCAPCRKEIPMLIAIQNKHAADNVQVVGIAVDFRDDVLKYADTMNIQYPLLIGEQDGLNAVDAFGIQAVGFPYTVFTDAKNNIITTYIGELHVEQVEAALAIIERINRGDLPLGAGRSEVTTMLAELKGKSAN